MANGGGKAWDDYDDSNKMNSKKNPYKVPAPYQMKTQPLQKFKPIMQPGLGGTKPESQ